MSLLLPCHKIEPPPLNQGSNQLPFLIELDTKFVKELRLGLSQWVKIEREAMSSTQCHPRVRSVIIWNNFSYLNLIIA